MSEEQKIILFLLLVVCITIHEWAHAWVADKLGDPLPRQQGRVTLDPRSHIDPIGTLLIPLVMIFASPGFAIIGWGKPVQISLPNRETKKRDDILITIAGPLSNLSIAFICSLSFGLFYRFVPLGESALLLLYQIVSLNAVLFLFNLLPIPPLDGSHILKNMVNMKDETFLKFSKYGFFILIILINIPFFQKWMGSGIEGLNSIFFGIFSLLQS
ncbi:MAG: site-2 protease family protein [Verrucomicrobia bacterium]|nr:site-2 protease family protein [Verrucomicrobiota bacterium]OUW39786.1 MAG: site-2 protease family protein [Verrucomicrobia bacterium TMED175]